ncbi:MAG: outer membrane lipoprotein carrier protein LolA [Candidatus Brocadiia bacterium]
MGRHKTIAVIWVTALLLAMPFGCGAAIPEGSPPAEEKPEVTPEVRRLLDNVDEANRELEDLTARVAYERAIPLLEEKERCRGRLAFKKPDHIWLELGRPRNEELYTDGETWWLVDHDDEQVEVYDATEEAAQETAFLQFGYGKGSEALLEDYEVELVAERLEEAEEGEQETFYRLKFTPRLEEDEPPPRYAAIEAEVSDRRWLPHLLVLHESGGEIVHTYELSRIRLNTGVKDEKFDYEPPGGYTVLRPAES